MAARLERRPAEADEPHRGEEQELHRLLDLLVRGVERRRARRPAAVQDEDVDAAERVHRLLDELLEVPRVRDVAADCERAEPVGLALEDVAAAREHRHVRALACERLRAAEADSGRGAADDGGAAAEPEVHQVVSTETTSRTASAEAASASRSPSSRSSSISCSIPPAPSLTGTPM